MSIRKPIRQATLALLAGTSLAMNGDNALAACGTDDHQGDLCLVGFNYCPRGTMEADGRLLHIPQYPGLFSLYGTTYGGDGRTTFALPDLRSRTPIGNGFGPGLSNYLLGEKRGEESHTLSVLQLPAHAHLAFTSVDVSVDTTLRATSASGNTDAPGGNVQARRNRSRLYSSGAGDVDMDQAAIFSWAIATGATTLGNTGTGANQSFDLRDPYLAIKYCVVVDGEFPSRP